VSSRALTESPEEVRTPPMSCTTGPIGLWHHPSGYLDPRSDVIRWDFVDYIRD
jgi:hypothetical protein